MDDTILEQQAELFKALMHPVRLALIEALRHSEECVCHLEAALGLRQAYISQQLAVLRKAGLVVDRRDGLNIYYRITQPAIFSVLETARAIIGAPPIVSTNPPRSAACPCPQCMAASGTPETAPIQLVDIPNSSIGRPHQYGEY